MQNNLEDELIDFLEASIADNETKYRNIDVVASFYGFRGLSWPTLDDVAAQYSIGTRERVRQIIKAAFKDHANVKCFPLLRKCSEVLKSKPYQSAKSYSIDLMENGIIWPGENVQGLLNLMHELELAKAYGTYTPEFRSLTRGQLEKTSEIFILKESEAKILASGLKKAMDLPGQLGIANLKNLKVREDWSDGEYYLLKKSIKATGLAWFSEENDNFWYIFENRDNTLLNYSKKVFSIINSTESRHLAEVYENALYARTNKFPYPSAAVIEKYLNGSVYFESENGVIEYRGSKESLNLIEDRIVDFLRKHGQSDFKSLSSHLEGEGFDRPYITKKTMFSPLVYVEKSLGRRNYSYTLVQSSKAITTKSSKKDRYEIYLAKLLKLLESGTDKETETKSRREQGLLQDWLFKDQHAEHCAICGELFDVSALVAAHKKRRADCTAAERLDPHIVMPLCLFGCDYLYERGYVYIKEGCVTLEKSMASKTAEFARAKKLDARKLDLQWAKGEEKGYFAKK